MRLLVCGSRGWTDRERLREIVSSFHPSVIIHGGARGADYMAGQLAGDLGIPTEVYKANWEQYGKSAGIIRNQEMLDKGQPDMVVAFLAYQDSRGTEHMIRIAKNQGLAVLVIRAYQDD